MSVIVVATITPKEGKLEEIEAVFATAIHKVHGEAGCELYALHRSKEGALVMIEKWADTDALKAHTKGPNMAEIGAGLAGKVAGPPELTMMDAAPYGDAGKGAV